MLESAVGSSSNDDNNSSSSSSGSSNNTAVLVIPDGLQVERERKRRWWNVRERYRNVSRGTSAGTALAGKSDEASVQSTKQSGAR